MAKTRKTIANTYIGDFGQMVQSIQLTGQILDIQTEDIVLENAFVDCYCSEPTSGLVSVETISGDTWLKFVPFLFRTNFSVKIGDLLISKANLDKVTVKDEDRFSALEEGDVLYRLYKPKADSPRPLILFLHGGGECGHDNMLQLTGTLGAIKLMERYPDMFILAPQAPDHGIDMQEHFEKMRSRGNPFRLTLGADTSIGLDERGWNRDYLGRVADLIRKMIGDGQVDPERVYAFGMSMGGAGIIAQASVAPGLFAGMVAICPSMNSDSFPLLENWPHIPLFLASAYIDHQANRHAYILRACNRLWAEGQSQVKYLLFTEEDLEKYGIVASKKFAEAEIRAANHNSWVLALHNEYGILDWLISQRKQPGG